MTLKQTRQEKYSLGESVASQVVVLKRDLKLKNRDIAVRLGINENYFSRIVNGHVPGSDQLLKGLTLLIHNIRQSGQIEQLEQRLRTVQSMYPGMVIPELAMNETVGKYTVSSEEKREPDLSAVKEISERHYPRQKKKQ